MFYKVFLDTNIYDGANYSFHNAMFQCMRDYARNGELVLVINSVVEGEVRAHIRERVSESVSALNKVTADRSFAGFRRLPHFQELLEKQDAQVWVDACQGEFSGLLADCRAQTITVDGIGVEQIVGDYFAQNPPFETKKPYEFKDAIAVSSLVRDIESSIEERIDGGDTEDIVYCVISNDGGFRRAVEAGVSDGARPRVKLFDTLRAFIAYTALIDRQAEFLRAYLLSDCGQAEMEETVREAVENAVLDISIENGCFVDDQDLIDVDDIVFRPYVLSLYEENGAAVAAKVALDVKCLLSVWYQYTDEDNSCWDKEDEVYLWKEEVEMNGTYEARLELVVALDIQECQVPEGWTPEEMYDFCEESVAIDSYLEMPGRIDLDEDNLVEEEVVERTDPFCEYEEGEAVVTERAFTTCPDCGCPIGVHNDGGNGYCIDCARRREEN